MHELHDKAIKAALAGDWETAVELNLEILANTPDHLGSLNRLGRAYTELGQKDAAKSAYNRVLSLDKYNAVATRNLKLLPHQQNGTTPIPLSDENFIELPGLTKSTLLIKVANRSTLLGATCKQQLCLSQRAKLIAITTTDGTYLGCLPDDLSLRLKALLKLGYTYSVCLKCASDNSATIFIRELSRPKKSSASPTFSRVVQLKKIRRSK